MDTSLVDPKAGGGGCADLREVLLGISPSEAHFWVRDVCGDPLYGEETGGSSPPGGSKYHGETPP